MRFLTYLAVILFSQACAHNADQIVNYEPSDPVATDNEPAPDAAPEYKYYVPRIKFDTEVSDESVAKATDIIEKVTEAGAKAIVIEWNTPGGDVEAGFKLAKTIEESKIPVVCVVDGESASMGMYLLESCQVRVMTRRSSLMVHEAAIGGTGFYGHEVKWRSVADRLRATNLAMVEHLCKRMKISPEDLSKKIAGGAQWWISYKEALEIEAVDYVVFDVKDVTESYRNTLGPPDLE